MRSRSTVLNVPQWRHSTACFSLTQLSSASRPAGSPPKGEIRQSVEYLGWTFSPRMRAMALFAAIAASPKPMVISVILPS